jgi:branched-chain amino acid transport system permease protein
MLCLRTFAGMYTEYWTMILGILLMVLIFFLPEGVFGFFAKRSEPRDPVDGRAAAAAEEA